MSVGNTADDGFSIVEVLIAVFLLGLVAVALLPALMQGIQLSSQQSAVATATRELNALVEDARADATCANLTDVAADRTVTDGSGRDIIIDGTLSTCPVTSKTVTLSLRALSESGSTLATTSAVIFVP